MANSSKIKTPLKFGWLVHDKQYHLTKIKTWDNGTAYYTCLCDIDALIEDCNEVAKKDNWYIWPDGIVCIEVLSVDTVCRKCLKLYGEDLTFPLIKAKLGVKNPFD